MPGALAPPSSTPRAGVLGAGCAALALAVALGAPALGLAQAAGAEDRRASAPDEATDETEPVAIDADETALPPLSLSASALAADADDDGPDAPARAGERGAEVIPRPRSVGPSEADLEAEEEGARRAEEDDEPAIVDDDLELPPDRPDLPEFRLRAGAGVALPTAGEFGVGLRLTQDFEWQPRGAEPFFVGVGGAETIGAGGTLGQVNLRPGLHAWFCDSRPIRCQAAIAFVGGVILGQGIVAPDFGGDVDLRILAWDWLEVHARGGFFILQSAAFIDITGGLGVAF